LTQLAAIPLLAALPQPTLLHASSILAFLPFYILLFHINSMRAPSHMANHILLLLLKLPLLEGEVLLGHHHQLLLLLLV
jgi:hypothetical protein